ncbi:MAG: hypothetical protein V4593_08400 [Pseudomonadota bacterium]
MNNGNEIQRAIHQEPLHLAVIQAAERIRDSQDYDVLGEDVRRFAVLCEVIQKVLTEQQLAKALDLLRYAPAIATE